MWFCILLCIVLDFVALFFSAWFCVVLQSCIVWHCVACCFALFRVCFAVLHCVALLHHGCVIAVSVLSLLIAALPPSLCLHCCIAAVLRCSSAACCVAALLQFNFTALQHCYIAALLHCCLVPLLHCCLAWVRGVPMHDEWVHGCIWVWVHGCMGAWVHGCMGAWVHGCMGAWVHGCMGAWVHGCTGAWVCAWVHACVGACVQCPANS